MAKYTAGVLYGDELEALYKDAKKNKFALPAVNVTGTPRRSTVRVPMSVLNMVSTSVSTT